MDVGGNLLPNTINPNHFPAKLWRLVNNPANEAICWDSEGTLIIIDQLLFEKQILSLDAKNSDNADAFKTTNFSSFVRQLNLYGFKKADPAIQDNAHSSGDNKWFHHFYNPNFKRNHPELLGSLMRLTVDNKAKMKTGVPVTRQTPTRFQQLGSSSGFSPTNETSPRPYYLNKAQAMAVYNGTPIPPQYLIRGHGAALSPTIFASNKGIPASLCHQYAGIASRSTPVHIQQGLQPRYPVNMCHGDHNLEPQKNEHQEEEKCDVSMDTIFQIADEVMKTPPGTCLVRAVPLEKLGPVIVSTSSISASTSKPASTMQDNPLCDTPIIMSTSGSTYVDKEQEELVLSVPEQMPEDAIFEKHILLPPSRLSAVLACFEVHHVRPGTAAAAEAMTVPQRRLAGLWPWLLMAALQVVLGQPGLESERPALRAVIKVALLNHEPTGKPITLEGVFVGGSAGFAEGKLMQTPTCVSESIAQAFGLMVSPEQGSDKTGALQHRKLPCPPSSTRDGC
ncbi:Heat shock factor protein 5 [Nibea albiflora]|uniref:Heat shock factor protein 5 n=1 Tax=Nibea albiflora TaxID=240163 RepID=A0ACB7F1Q2_NIBAL|nr:Heat shock factor protein 5 [Nibea albiflora]